MDSLGEPNESDMRKYFEPGEWDSFSEFDRKRYISMLHNYLIMTELDLNPEEPDFIRKWKIRYLTKSSNLNSRNQNEKKIFSEASLPSASGFDKESKEQGFQRGGGNAHPPEQSFLPAQIGLNKLEEFKGKNKQSAVLHVKSKQSKMFNKPTKTRTRVSNFVSPKITSTPKNIQLSSAKCTEVISKPGEFGTKINVTRTNQPDPSLSIHTIKENLLQEATEIMNPSDKNCKTHLKGNCMPNKERKTGPENHPESEDNHESENKFSAMESVYESLFSDEELSQSAVMWNFFQSMFEAYVHELMKSNESREIVQSVLSSATRERLGLRNHSIARREGSLPSFFEEPYGTGSSFHNTDCNSENVDSLNDDILVAQDLIWDDCDNQTKVKDNKSETFFYCGTCSRQWNDICPQGHQIFSPDQIFSYTFSNDISNSLPLGLRISKSTLPLCTLGVFSDSVIEVGVIWGPMKDFNFPHTDFSQETLLSRHDYPRCTRYPGYWMNLVNCAYSEKEANTISFVHCGKLYFKSIRRIEPNDEVQLSCWVENSLPPGSSVPAISITGIDSAKNKLINVKSRSIEVLDKQIYLHINNGKNGNHKRNQQYLENCIIFKNGKSSTGIEEENSLKRNYKTVHSVERPYVCKECGKGFSLKRTLVDHFRTHSGERPYVCKECGKGYIQKGDLVYHIRTHSGERPYVCKECGKGFSQKNTLVKHIRTHSGERPYVCKECGKGYIQKGDLVNHIRTHSGERPYVCKECGKGFSQKGHLVYHIRSHSGERPYVCKECGKGCIQKGDLVKHIWTHSGERPYVCKECGKGYIQKGDLVNHIRTHSGERPYVCKECGKGFSQKGYLVDHIRTHSGERPYVC